MDFVGPHRQMIVFPCLHRIFDRNQALWHRPVIFFRPRGNFAAHWCLTGVDNGVIFCTITGTNQVGVSHGPGDQDTRSAGVTPAASGTWAEDEVRGHRRLRCSHGTRHSAVRQSRPATRTQPSAASGSDRGGTKGDSPASHPGGLLGSGSRKVRRRRLGLVATNLLAKNRRRVRPRAGVVELNKKPPEGGFSHV